MHITPTKLRADLYNVIDKVIATGIPVEIVRRGRVVKIIAEQPKNKLDNLIKHPGTIVGNPDDLVHMDWSSQWSEAKNL